MSIEMLKRCECCKASIAQLYKWGGQIRWLCEECAPGQYEKWKAEKEEGYP